MATSTLRPETDWTVADLLRRFGPIPHRRIRQNPPPGSATVQDVIDIHEREGRLYELVDGVLVEKVMGFYESALACVIIRLLGTFVHNRNIGIVTAPDGMIRLTPNLVRIPDVGFFSWDRFPSRRVPSEPVPLLAPDLAVEVLSKGNTKKEMDEKLVDYFEAGARLVWYVDPVKRTVRAFDRAGSIAFAAGKPDAGRGGCASGAGHPDPRDFLRAGRARVGPNGEAEAAQGFGLTDITA